MILTEENNQEKILMDRVLDIHHEQENMKHVLIPILMPIMGEGNGTPLQYSCLENPMDGGAY